MSVELQIKKVYCVIWVCINGSVQVEHHIFHQMSGKKNIDVKGVAGQKQYMKQKDNAIYSLI